MMVGAKEIYDAFLAPQPKARTGSIQSVKVPETLHIKIGNGFETVALLLPNLVSTPSFRVWEVTKLGASVFFGRLDKGKIL